MKSWEVTLPYMIVRISNGEYAAVSPNPLPLNVWEHIVGVRRGTSLEIWENGFLIASTTIPSGPMDVNDAGSFNLNLNAGSISAVRDEVRVYNRALSGAEIQTGLVGWWRFDEGAGGVAADSSGNGNSGTIYGGTWVDGKYGEALSSAASSSNSVDVAPSSSLNITGDVTVEMWIMRTGTDTGYAQLGSKLTNTGQIAWGLHEVMGSYTPYMIVRISNGEYAAVSPNPLPLNVWEQIVGVRRGTSLEIWENGFLIAATAIPSGPMDVNDAGSFNLNLNAGSISAVRDEVRVYNRALSGAEIQTDFQTSPGFASSVTAKIPAGTTQVIVTLAWQGTGSINATITSPSKSYTEDQIPVYAKTTYSTTSTNPSMLNIKRLSVSVTALPAGQTWTIVLTHDTVPAYQITVEVQK